jgi:hypothetical protein
MRSLLLLCVVGCGEHAYYPALAPPLDTAVRVEEPPLQCGITPELGFVSVEVVNLSDQTRHITAVDAYCVESDVGTAPPGFTFRVDVPASDALAAYEDVPAGRTRVGVRLAVPGQDPTWLLP